jgi:hypothetical protein
VPKAIRHCECSVSSACRNRVGAAKRCVVDACVEASTDARSHVGAGTWRDELTMGVTERPASAPVTARYSLRSGTTFVSPNACRCHFAADMQQRDARWLLRRCAVPSGDTTRQTNATPIVDPLELRISSVDRR